MTYSELTNGELRGESTNLLFGMRRFVEEWQTADLDALSQGDWKGRNQASEKLSQEQMGQYEMRFMAESTLLRHELLRRLPAEVSGERIHRLFWYENPTNRLGVQKVIQSLDQLTRALPADRSGDPDPTG